MSLTTNLTRYKKPDIEVSTLRDRILDKTYKLSVVYVDDSYSKKLNLEYRKKDSPTNVLSFPLTDDTGEIFINLDIAKKEYKEFEMTYDGYIGFLLVHGLLHLKGLAHGSTMEKMEKEFIKEFNFR